ncbi:hypothetical protein [Meiothermus hypogaeus]|uniref:Uncharacterized protein n=2 Tax=Meiothermus hypogaeus TaxID=884155 RepID=A0A511R5H5_9DEIN|nr:hypothetical protein [Meiothermus hypogaeus]RIH80252.1 hypothetical protein Mhypo_00723 [Meiothermus hypogaeus]GEM84256.1 hypothetical protein MHY01S_24220 [Meiothermus hypogaeus NBRC 106114]GIW37552.1 MAG: hypothetical protein KatS3mg073_1697 [Meiothermus sp.]
MKVHWQEVAMVAAIVWIFGVVSQIQQKGFWLSLLTSLPLGLLAGVAYQLLMPWVIRWAARGLPKESPPPTGREDENPDPSDEPSARP